MRFGLAGGKAEGLGPYLRALEAHIELGDFDSPEYRRLIKDLETYVRRLVEDFQDIMKA